MQADPASVAQRRRSMRSAIPGVGRNVDPAQRFDGRARGHAQAESLRHLREKERGLQQSEVFAHAHPRARPKRDVGKLLHL